MTKTKQEKNKFCLANDCTHVLPTGRRKYCSDKCANRIKKRAYRANKATDTYQVEKIVDTNVQKRRGNYYAIMDKKNFFDDLLKGTKTKQEVADILG